MCLGLTNWAILKEAQDGLDLGHNAYVTVSNKKFERLWHLIALVSWSSFDIGSSQFVLADLSSLRIFYTNLYSYSLLQNGIWKRKITKRLWQACTWADYQNRGCFNVEKSSWYFYKFLSKIYNGMVSLGFMVKVGDKIVNYLSTIWFILGQKNVMSILILIIPLLKRCKKVFYLKPRNIFVLIIWTWKRWIVKLR